jgi:hypothetical protein
MVEARIARIFARDERRAEKIEFRFIFVAMLILFVVAALVDCMLPWRWPDKDKFNGKGSIIERARENAGTYAGLAFMG